MWLQYQEVDEAAFEDPDKISQSPLSFEGLPQSISLFLVRLLRAGFLACPSNHTPRHSLAWPTPPPLLRSWCGSSPSRWRIDDFSNFHNPVFPVIP